MLRDLFTPIVDTHGFKEYPTDEVMNENLIECIKIANEHAIKFAEWIRVNAYDTGLKWYYQEDNEEYTTEEIFNLFMRSNQTEL